MMRLRGNMFEYYKKKKLLNLIKKDSPGLQDEQNNIEQLVFIYIFNYSKN